MFLVAKFQSVAIPNVVREVMLLLSLFREVTTCYGFTGKERRLSTKVRVPEKENKYNAIMISYFSMLCLIHIHKIQCKFKLLKYGWGIISINTIPLSFHVTNVSLFFQIHFFGPENCFYPTHLIDL